jgi:hypothetical protein
VPDLLLDEQRVIAGFDQMRHVFFREPRDFLTRWKDRSKLRCRTVAVPARHLDDFNSDDSGASAFVCIATPALSRVFR